MRLELCGEAGTPTMAVIGAWEPLTCSSLHLFRRLARRAKAEGLRSCVIVIHPAPIRFLQLNDVFREFDDLEARLALIRACGVDSTLTAHFSEADLGRTAKYFLSRVQEQVVLRDLWLGASQSLGSGPEGSRIAIERLARELQFKLRIMRPNRNAFDAQRVWAHLACGEIGKASRLVGRPPVRTRPSSGSVEVGWRPGDYPAVPLAEAREVLSLRTAANPIMVRVRKQARSTRLHWPSTTINWLALVGDRRRSLRAGQSPR
jgi:FAD synthase